jgi:VCBS repeat-containing protein
MTTTVNTINGNEGNNRLTGTSRNDVINGNGGNDRLNGGSGADILNGGAGKDELNGGSGNDVLDGGSGSDELEGGSGNDTLIYTLAENNVIGKTTYDEYDGGSGSDTLELRFTRAEWMNTNNQTVLQNYINWASKSGTGCRWDDDFTFRFSNARLEIEDIEKLVVKVDGATIKDLGINTVDAVEDSIKISEDSTGEEIYVLGNDKANYLVKDLILKTGPANGSVTLFKVDSNDPSSWYFKYSPNNAYQYLNTDLTATDSFKYTVIDAKGKEDTATVTITIEGANDAAIIGDPPINQLIEDSNSPGSSYIFLDSSLTISDVDNAPRFIYGIFTTQLRIGQLYLSDVGQYIYQVDNRQIQYLSEGQPLTESFTIMAVDGTPKTISFTITGVNDAAVIGDPSNNQVTEDAGDIVDGFITLTGNITIFDDDNNEAFFQTQVTTSDTNKGSLDLNSDGSYIYKVKNADLQSLNASDHPKDEFKIYAKDGTEKTIFITINGSDDVVNSAPVVKELGQGENKYAGSANVRELINLDHFKSSTPVNTEEQYKAKYDFDHVRTGHFSFSDSNLTDTFAITSKAAGPEGNLGTLNFDYAKAKDSGGNIIDGEYIIKWTYTVKDSDLDSMNTPASGSTSKDDDFIVTIDDGTAKINTKIMLNLFGRDEVKFVGNNDTAGNNVREGTDGPDRFDFVRGNDVLYLRGGDDYLDSTNTSVEVVYGDSGNDRFRSGSLDTVFFGGDGDDNVSMGSGFSKGLLFGENGNDRFTYEGDGSAEGRKTYAWGGAGSDFFEIQGKSSKSIDWVMDFDARKKPIDGGDKIYFNSGIPDFNWDQSITELEKKSADNEHPFLSEGADYYELRVNISTNENIENWLSVLNLVGVDDTEFTLQNLIDNKNLV